MNRLNCALRTWTTNHLASIFIKSIKVRTWPEIRSINEQWKKKKMKEKFLFTWCYIICIKICVINIIVCSWRIITSEWWHGDHVITIIDTFATVYFISTFIITIYIEAIILKDHVKIVAWYTIIIIIATIVTIIWALNRCNRVRSDLSWK